MIAFVGSVFSPYYRRALARDPATPAEDHCAINVCLYGPGANRWTMTERGARHVQRQRERFVVGPSQWHWTGDALEIALDERGAPWPRAVRGTLRLRPRSLTRFQAALDGAGRHRWGPIAPCARIEVALRAPALRWHGDAYLDCNEGDEPIERGFTRWDWLRTAPSNGSTAVVYDVQPREGPARVIARRFGTDGVDAGLEAPPRRPLPPAPLWRIGRHVRADGAARVLRTLEDTPFYARSLLELALHGDAAGAVHESLDLRRLCSPVVQAMLPWRMPRRA